MSENKVCIVQITQYEICQKYILGSIFYDRESEKQSLDENQY